MMKKPSESPKKARISIAIDREFLIWIDEMIKKSVFANRSHSIHRALVKLKEEVSKQVSTVLMLPTYRDAETQTASCAKIRALVSDCYDNMEFRSMYTCYVA